MTEWPENLDVMNTKLVNPLYESAHVLYAGRIDQIAQAFLMAAPPFRKNEPALFEISEREALDIDYEWQFESYAHLYEALNKCNQ